MKSHLTILSEWSNDQGWIGDGNYSRDKFYRCVNKIISKDTEYTITSQDVVDYLVNEFPHHSDKQLVEDHAKTAGIQFGVIQAFCKANKLVLN
ncbi:hypothetical protein [Citrobacter portucalensis]|uniref:hypothetical protein n=1 Tax=Citrobacter portucalensis TaxID=1639133 RepID=UPI0030CB3C16|nr:hypothetical protein [Citrobacter freundii]